MKLVLDGGREEQRSLGAEKETEGWTKAVLIPLHGTSPVSQVIPPLFPCLSSGLGHIQGQVPRGH